MQNSEELEDASKMVALLITELDKPNGLYKWLRKFGENYSLTRYVALSGAFCQEKRNLPNVLPSLLHKLVVTQENLLSLHHLWCCFWNTYERIRDDSLWQDSVERHPLLAQLDSTTKSGMRFATASWKIVVKIRNENPTVNPWVLTLAAFSLLLKAMKSYATSYQQWELLCTMRFRGSIDLFLLGGLYRSSSRCWEFPLEPPPGFAPGVITTLVTDIIRTQVCAATESNTTGVSSLADNTIRWLQTHENNTENLNPTILMTEYMKYLEKGKGLNPFVFLAKPADDLLVKGATTGTDGVSPNQSLGPVARASQERMKESTHLLVVASDPPASRGTATSVHIDERQTDNALKRKEAPPLSQSQEPDSSDEGTTPDVASNDETEDDASIQQHDMNADGKLQNSEELEDASKMVALLITELDKPNGLYKWLRKFGENYSLTRYVALSGAFCQEKRNLPNVLPSLLHKLVVTQENLLSLHHLWCCFWNTYERIRDDSLWQDSVERHPLLAQLDSTTKSGMKFVTIAWKIVVKLRNKNTTLNPWVLTLVAFSLLLKAMRSDPRSYQQWELLWEPIFTLRFRWSLEAFLLEKLYLSRSRCREFPLNPPLEFGANDKYITSLVRNIVTTQVHAANESNSTGVSPLAESIIKWLQTCENSTENLDPTILMTEYAEYLEKGKGLNPFVFLTKPPDNLLLKGSMTNSKASTGEENPNQSLIRAARTVQESTDLPVVASHRQTNNLLPFRKELTSKEASPLSQPQERDLSDEDTTHGVETEEDASVQEHHASDDATRNHDKRSVSNTKQNSEETKKRKLNPDASRSKRLATAMALVVKELNKINQDLPDSSAEPPYLSDSMELTEWTVSLLIVDNVGPSNKLNRYLNDASPHQWTKELIPTLNRTLLRFSQENLVDKATRTAPVSVSKSDGTVQIHGNVTDDKLMSKAVILLYYHALEAILAAESERLKITSHPQIVLYSVFHKALLACCMWCVTKAVGVTQKLRASPCLQALSIQSTLRVCDSNPYDFLKVSESFLRVLCLGISDLQLGSPLPQKLPRLLHRDLQSMEVIILDSLLWSTSILNGTAGSMPEQIEDFMSKTDDEVRLWPPEILAPTLREETSESGHDVTYPTPEHDDFAEYRCVNYLIRSVVKLSFSRFEDICGLLRVPVEYPVVTQAWVAFRHLLRHHVDLLFDRHTDQWILCCLYGVAKALSYPLTFVQIIEAYIKSRGPIVGDVTCQHILRYIRMDNTSHDLTTGDIIALYNRVWVPTMKPYLVASDSLQESAKKVQELLQIKEQMRVTN